MTDKVPSKNNNYYLVGGPLTVDKNQKVEIPPKNAKKCNRPTIALISGDYLQIKAEDNTIIKENGTIIARKNKNGEILTSKATKSSKTRKKADSSHDII